MWEAIFSAAGRGQFGDCKGTDSVHWPVSKQPTLNIWFILGAIDESQLESDHGGLEF